MRSFTSSQARWVLATIGLVGVVAAGEPGVGAAGEARAGGAGAPRTGLPRDSRPRASEATQGADAVYFLRIAGIEGEVTDERYPGWIELTSFSWGESQPGLQRSDGVGGGGGGGGAGKPTLQGFHVTARASKATPALVLATASGQRFQEALIAVTQAGAGEFLKYRLTDVVVGSYRATAGLEGAEPIDAVSLEFSRLEVEYRPQNPDGSLGEPIRAGWDFRANAAL